MYRDGTDVGTAPATSFSDTGVTAGATYAYTVKAMDGAGRLSDASDAISVTTPAPDTTPPSVALGAPAAGATVTGTTTVTASASDDGAVAGVQFLLDGANLGAEDTTAPYGVAWDTSAATNGAHTLGARARDAAGNTATATTVSVTVANGGTDPAQVGRWGPLVPLPAVAIHSALTPAGKILLFQGDFTHGGDQYLFDPVTNAVTHAPGRRAQPVLRRPGRTRRRARAGRGRHVHDRRPRPGRQHGLQLAERQLERARADAATRAGTRPRRRCPTARCW